MLEPEEQVSPQLRAKLEAMRKHELLTLASSVDCEGVSGLSKSELIDRLIDQHSSELNNHFSPPSRRWSQVWGASKSLVWLIGFVASVLTIYVILYPPGGDPQPPPAEGEGLPARQTDWRPAGSSLRPTILTIYPSDTFGPIRLEAIKLYCDKLSPEFDVINVRPVTTKEMKARNIDPVLRDLKRLLDDDQQNVLAIVGSPVTECTEPLLDAIADSGVAPPVVLECAGPPHRIGWTRHAEKLNVFRINSGVDLRAKEIAALIADAVRGGVEVHLFVESDPGTAYPTYGELLREAIQQNVGDWSRYIRKGDLIVTKFPKSRAAEASDEFRQAANKKALVIHCGLARDYLNFAQVYRANDDQDKSAPRASFVGWMNAYTAEAVFKEGRHDLWRLFEITDVDFQTPGPPSGEQLLFRQFYGGMSPALRDQAFSFDAAHCLVESYKRIDFEPPKNGSYPKIDDEFHARLVAALRKGVFHGVTGLIQFGPDGQNISGQLEYCRYDLDQNRWLSINYKELLSPQANPRASKSL